MMLNYTKIGQYRKLIGFCTIVLLISCGNTAPENKTDKSNSDGTKHETKSDTLKNRKKPKDDLTFKTNILTGADQTNLYLEFLKGKKIAITANPTSVIGETHLVDSLKSLGLDIKKVFALEHGFRGNIQAGEHVKNGMDKKTGLPIISLYGKNKQPTAEQLKEVDVIVFDLQDVGARFYTYISSLHYIMLAAAENNITVLILDRPNPNGHYVAGPVMEKEHESFVGMHPVPIVHGMTIGEYAQMINGEGWLGENKKCELKVIPCKNYTHNDFYEIKIKPSPNLSTMASIYLYPSLCLFEGTNVSVGRGTDKPFRIIGMPGLKSGDFTFTPKSVEAAKNPPHKDKECTGFDLTDFGNMMMRQQKDIYLFWLIGMYENCSDKNNFFTKDGMFELLAGTSELKKQIKDGKTEEEIKKTWEPGLKKFKETRKKYLLYQDFE
jgi:uncharacterized protein YbbC (DUF1343 family)